MPSSDKEKKREQSRRWQNANREKVRAANRRWRERNPEKMRALQEAWRVRKKAEEPDYDRRTRLKTVYGLTPESFEAKLAAQGGVCAVCKTGELSTPGWHVDHDHSTGATRGILCPECNRMLGQAKDDPERLRAAASYLDWHRL